MSFMECDKCGGIPGVTQCCSDASPPLPLQEGETVQSIMELAEDFARLKYNTGEEVARKSLENAVRAAVSPQGVEAIVTEQQIIDWLSSPEGKQRIAESSARSAESIAMLNAARKISPELLIAPMSAIAAMDDEMLSVVVGFDAFRIARGVEPKYFTAAGVIKALQSFDLAAPAGLGEAKAVAPEGFCLVPLLPNSEMVRVMADDEWLWEDLLAAAEAITEVEYNTIAAAPIAPDLPVAAEKDAVIWPEEMTQSLKVVLGRPNFWCAGYAEIYRKAGHVIPRKSEEEQAFILHRFGRAAVIHGDEWADVIQAELTSIKESMQSPAGGGV